MHKGYLSDGTGFVDIKFDKIYDVFSRLSRGASACLGVAAARLGRRRSQQHMRALVYFCKNHLAGTIRQGS